MSPATCRHSGRTGRAYSKVVRHADRRAPVFSAAPKTPAERLAAALASLNEAQRAAVEHGVQAAIGDAGGGLDERPLLVIAGAGSGKTSTLAHRVATSSGRRRSAAHAAADLLAPRRAGNGAPRRQRAARCWAEGRGAARLPWAGTFHGIGARLLREYAPQIGLDESFTIHDRGDAEDLMGLVRHEIGLSSTVKRFPRKGTCLSIYSRVREHARAAGQVLQRPSLVRANGRPSSRSCSAPTSRPSSSRTCSTTTTCCSSGPR
jgi:DNA helicase-2/ATP-dependent DNA helicase PcrA